MPQPAPQPLPQPAPGWQMIAHWVPSYPSAYSEKVRANWTSQVRQDRTVAYLMDGKRQGYFVDLAANDAVHLSNTLTLENVFGWTGLCIEANPEYFEGLNFRRCRVVHAVVGQQNYDKVQFAFQGSGGGLVGSGFDNKGGAAAVEVGTVSINQIFQDLQVPERIDYLSLDIEGAEEFVFNTFAWDRYVFSCFTVERPKPKFRALALQYGYVYVCDHADFGDELWVHTSFRNGSQRVQSYLLKNGFGADPNVKKQCPEV